MNEVATTVDYTSVSMIIVYLSVALGISESLALLPFLKENSILEIVIKVLRALIPAKK